MDYKSFVWGLFAGVPFTVGLCVGVMALVEHWDDLLKFLHIRKKEVNKSQPSQLIETDQDREERLLELKLKNRIAELAKAEKKQAQLEVRKDKSKTRIKEKEKTIEELFKV